MQPGSIRHFLKIVAAPRSGACQASSDKRFLGASLIAADKNTARFKAVCLPREIVAELVFHERMSLSSWLALSSIGRPVCACPLCRAITVGGVAAAKLGLSGSADRSRARATALARRKPLLVELSPCSPHQPQRALTLDDLFQGVLGLDSSRRDSDSHAQENRE